MTPSVSRRQRALGWICGTLVLYSISPSATVYLARRGIDSAEMFFLYSAGSLILLLACQLVAGFKQERRIILRFGLNAREIIIAFLLGIFGYVLFYALYLTAMSRASDAGVPVVMAANYMWPLFTFIFLAIWVDRRPIRLPEWIGLLVSAAGVYFCRAGSKPAEPSGQSLAAGQSVLLWPLVGLAGAVVWGAFTAATQRWKIRGIGSILIYNLVAFVATGLWLIFRGFNGMWSDHLGVIVGLLSGMLFYALANWVYFEAMERHPTAGELALFNFSPFLALLVVMITQGIAMGWQVWVGAMIIIIGVMVARYRRPDHVIRVADSARIEKSAGSSAR